MSQAAGKTHNLDDEGGEESLRALIRSIVPDAPTNSNGKYSADIVDKLAEKLTELLGPDAFQEPAHPDPVRRNDKGELLNEDGLPIIEINERADATQFQYTESRPAPITVEPLLPLANLPTHARDQLRARRNRILDQLEEEERAAEIAEEQREQQEEQERKEAAAQRRTEKEHERSVATEKAKAARELQKKMGRALIQNVGKAREQERAEQEAQRVRDEEADKRRASPNIKKKTVAFVDSPEAKLRDDDDADNEGSSSKLMDWGDLAPGRLRSNKRPTLMAQSLLDKHPMKMNVVERVPGGTPTMAKPKLPSTPISTSRPVDSDDESEPEESSGSDTEIDSENDGEAALDQDAVDLDYARLQRDIALEYYQKRNQIGEAAASAMMNHTHDEDERVPPEADVLRESSKPAISQFRANKLVAAYNVSTGAGPEQGSSTSLGASVLSAPSARTIQKAIRTGKLDDDGKLVGGENDSASEDEDGGLQEVLELLRKGEVYNLGPDGKYIHAVHPNSKQGPNNSIAASSSSTSAPSSAASSSQTAASSLPPLVTRSKISKFKADRTAAGRPGPSSLSSSELSTQLNLSDMPSPSVTPISHAGRSSPKMDTPTVPVAITPPTIRSPVPAKAHPQSPPQFQAQSSPFSMIVESPSFPNLSRSSGSRAHGHEHPYDTELAAVYAETTPGSSSRAGAATQPRRPQKPPTVIATTVLERKPVGKPLGGTAPNQSSGNGDANIPQTEKKVSRFGMAGRK